MTPIKLVSVKIVPRTLAPTICHQAKAQSRPVECQLGQGICVFTSTCVHPALACDGSDCTLAHVKPRPSTTSFTYSIKLSAPPHTLPHPHLRVTQPENRISIHSGGEEPRGASGRNDLHAKPALSLHIRPASAFSSGWRLAMTSWLRTRRCSLGPCLA